jgi:hypothetical protein
MNKRAIIGALLAPVLLAGCDNIFGLDNYAEPNAMLSGEVVFEGQAVGVRSNGVQLELWQPGPEFELNTKIPVYVDQNGSFSASVFNGDYELNLLPGNGPWLNNPTRIPVQVRGNTTVQVPVTPYYTIRSPAVTLNTGVNAPVGAIQGTFQIGQIDTSRNLEFVGMYVGTTAIVDRANGLSIPNAQRERTLAALGGVANLGNPVTISVNLPAGIHLTPSPARRDHVFVRFGVKTVGVAELMFSPIFKVAIS